MDVFVPLVCVIFICVCLVPPVTPFIFLLIEVRKESLHLPHKLGVPVNLVARDNFFDVVFFVDESCVCFKSVVLDLALHSRLIRSLCLIISLLRGGGAIWRVRGCSRSCLLFRWI